MNSVNNTKVLIFDDKPEEIQNLREALDDIGIQSIYINFKTSKKKNKFTNVRYIFADLTLDDKISSSNKSTISPIYSSITRNLSEDNGAFILIIWSKHNELRNVLIDKLKERKYKFYPIVTLDKNDYKKNEINIIKKFEQMKWCINKKELTLADYQHHFNIFCNKSINYLINDIKNSLNQNLDYFNLLREWESQIQKSSAKVFDMFLDIENQDKNRDLLNGAIKSIVGTNQSPNKEEKRKGLYPALNMVLQDTIEKSVEDSNSNETTNNTLKNLDLQVKNNENTYIVNSKLLFEIPLSSNKKMYPGNIFCFESYLNICDKLNENVCGYDDYKKIFEDEIYDYNSKYKSELEKQQNEAKDEYNERIKNKTKQDTLDSIKPILIEFTPYCDYSNNKFKKSRLIFGYLVPFDKQCIKKLDNFYKSGFSFNYESQNYILLLSLRHIFGLNPKTLENLKLLFRARKELVNDIQHNIAYHISRVGVTSL